MLLYIKNFNYIGVSSSVHEPVHEYEVRMLQGQHAGSEPKGEWVVVEHLCHIEDLFVTKNFNHIGVSPSGKASDSDSDIPVFESQYPSQLH